MKLLLQFKFIAIVSMVMLFSKNTNAQCGPLSTPNVTNNGQSGIMFDIVAITSVEITQLGMDYDNGTYNLEVYTIAGTHVGNETNAGAWTLLGTVNGWTGTTGSNNMIPVLFSVVLCPGESQGFYITASNSTSGNYSNGTGVGNVAAADANIQILEGTGKAHAFANSYTPRVPNVTVNYNCLMSCCTPPTMSMTQETCTGSCDGTATATVGAGGVPPYTYQWDAAAGNQTTQTATGLCSGTYDVVVTDNTGCQASGTITVTSGGALANATITPAGPFCDNDIATNLTAVDPGGTWSGTGITDAVNGTFDPATAGVGIHTITYTIPGACGDTQTTDITVSASSNATITAVGPFCTAEPSLNLTAVDPGGTWTGNGITDAINGTFDPATAGVGTHTITYTIPGLCGDVQTTDITISNALDATITPAGPFCVTEPSLNLTAVDAGGTWSGNGITDAINGTFDPATAGAGTHTITYTISGICGDVQTTDITVDPQLDATITPVGPFCTAEPALNLTAVDAGGTWSGTGITDVANGTFDPATAGIGTHTITYTIPGTCGDVQTVDITIDATFDASITAVGPYCESNAAVSLNAVDLGGTWSGTGITDAVNGIFDPNTAGPGTHTITYTIAGVCGDSQTTDITIDPDLDATITPVGPFCDSEPALNLSGIDAGGTWSGNGVTDAVNGTFDPATAGFGIHTITYDIPGMCGDIQTYDITINTTFDASITQVGPFCLIEPSLNLTAVDPGGTWTGNGITDAINGTFNPATAGVGTHTITYTIPGACGDTQTSDIVVNSMDDATITAAGPLCLGDVINLSAVTPGGTWSGAGITNPATGEFTAAAAGPGTHTVTYITNGPCPDTATIDIDIYGPLVLQATGATAICEGEVVYLSATGSGGNGNISYEWTDQNGTIVGNTANISVSPSTTTTYTVTLSDDCNSPIKMVSQVVIVYPIPTISLIADNTSGCLPLEVNFTNTSSPIGSDCTWDFGNGETSNNCGSALATYTSPGCYDVTLTVTENGCTNTETYTDYICLAEEPEANFAYTPEEGSMFDTEFEFINQSTNADTYHWDFDDEGATSTEVNPIHVYAEEPGGYMVCLIASNAYGCHDTLCRPITIVEDILFFLPNSFTPDGDEFNQAFTPIFTSGIDEYNFSFRIFNRWGEVIWESNDPSIGWDATYGKNGVQVPTGTYVWKLEFKYPNNDDKIRSTGHVNVLK
jgi:gliding motility-associated-like protein